MFTIEIMLTALISLAAGAIASYLYFQKKISSLRENNSSLNTTLEIERNIAKDKLAEIEKNRDQLKETFKALSSDALKTNNEEFLRLAQENLKRFNVQAQHDLDKKEQAIENLVKPIKEVLEKTEKQIREIESERKEAYGSITKYLETMTQTQQLLHGETQNLVKALRRPEVRGQWGEMTLKRLVELAGMVEHCDFYEQEHQQTDDGAFRPDMIVRMPGKREIIVDVKTPLDAYLNAVESSDEQSRDNFLEQHSRKVKERIRELASKSYWSQFSNSPDFVVLFIPGDHFLSAALDKDPSLLESALQQKIILATPTSLVALLRAIAYGWNQQSITDNAEKIKVLGEELYKRICTFTGHLAKLGKNINNSVDHYNNAVGSLQRQVLSSARKFSEMGINPPKPPEKLDPIDNITRSIEHEIPND
ncbi:MAG: DNA recombination protein RmuC [Gammaproteobacteria bacterium]